MRVEEGSSAVNFQRSQMYIVQLKTVQSGSFQVDLILFMNLNESHKEKSQQTID